MTEPPALIRGQRSHPLLVLLGILTVPVVALLDYLAGPEFGFSLFYLLPIALVAATGGWTSAWFTAVLAAIAWMIIDVLTTPSYTTFLAPLWNSLTRFAFFAFALLAVRNYQDRLASAELRALSDPLTGLPNRQYLLIMLNAARARLERYDKPLTLVYLDVDDFKHVNDTQGHQAGDVLLKQIASLLTEVTRDTDTVARVGGDEFVMLLPEASEETLAEILERLREALASQLTANGRRVSFSMGACTFYRAFDSAESMIRMADERMYRVKRSGKDSVAVAKIR